MDINGLICILRSKCHSQAIQRYAACNLINFKVIATATDIQYDIPEGVSISNGKLVINDLASCAADVIARDHFKNSTELEQTYHSSLHGETTTTESWTTTKSVEVGAAFEVETNALIAKSKLTGSLTVGYSKEHTKELSETVSWDKGVDVAVAPMGTASVAMIVYKSEIELNFTATVALDAEFDIICPNDKSYKTKASKLLGTRAMKSYITELDGAWNGKGAFSSDIIITK